MIIKSAQRAGAAALALHLIKDVDIDGHTQTVDITSSRYLFQDYDVRASLQDMELMATAAPRCQKHLYHVSVSPECPMSADQWDTFWETYETEFGLQNLAYIELTHDHLNHERPPHKHRVYERVDTSLAKAVELSHTKVRNEKIARLMEHAFGHPLTIGKHNRAVMLRLKEEGHIEVAYWMEAGRAHEVERPVAHKDHNDYQQEKRTKIPLEQVKNDLQTAWKHTDTGLAFEAAIAEKGYILARGDRRDFVIVDRAGGIHSPRRRLGVKVKDLRQRWADLNLEHLPTVEQIKSGQNAIPKVDKSDLNAALQTLHEAKTKTDDEIARLEAELQALAREAEQTKQGDPQTSTPPAPSKQSDTFEAAEDEENTRDIAPFTDQRALIALQHYWQQLADRESIKPQALAADEAKAWGISHTTFAVMQVYAGQQAIDERDRRIEAALNAKPDTERPALSDYLTTLGAHLKNKGQRYYRTADRWLTERLAKLGYSRSHAKRVLATASPELMNKQPGQRVSYIRGLVERVYQVWERDPQNQQAIEGSENKDSKASERSDRHPPKPSHLPNKKPQKPAPPSKPQNRKRQRHPRR